VEMRTVVMLFTRDLRIRDNPALDLACTTADRVVPLFVRDPALSVPPNRERFLLESLADLRESLRAKGGELVIRHGDPVAETVKMVRQFDAVGVAMMADVSAYAQARQRGLESERLMVKALPGVTVVPPGEIKPTTGAAQYKVFTPYFRAWQGHRWRDIAPTPKRIEVPEGLQAGLIDALPSIPEWTGGETAGLKRLRKWRPLSDGYADHHNDLAGDRTFISAVFPRLGWPPAVCTTLLCGSCAGAISTTRFWPPFRPWPARLIAPGRWSNG
jgi:deoxyribodipyrimidine photo-lyase